MTINYLARFSRLTTPSISKLQRQLSSSLEVKLKPLNISLSEFRIIGLLMGENKGLSQKELAQKLFISSPSVSVAMTKLEKKEWVVRVQDKDDQRVKRICLKSGVDFAEIDELLNMLESDLTSGISLSDLDTTKRVLKTMQNNLDNVY